ncbi:MAG TPA: type II toxin-antitoxin system VapC family toxin [Verrucomicrobiae bacterium]|nr:type II toxin-antitoxin system VapC family toxin [Verrucomicrobiae bacterium]
MKLLLDTQVLVGCLDGPEKLPRAVVGLLKDVSQYPVGVSAISAWEVARLASSGRVQLSRPPGDWLRLALRAPFVQVLPLTAEIACEASTLPGEFRGDPADQIIVATARIHGLTLVTGDPRMLSYPHLRVVWGY